MEFYRVISNIVNNAIKAMNGQGIIIAKSYEYLGNAVIKIENNGPKIEEHHLKDIFKVGFTTKDNIDKSHGYGLSIVKDLVESNNGKIYVKSTDTATEFKIVLPIKNEISSLIRRYPYNLKLKGYLLIFLHINLNVLNCNFSDNEKNYK